MSVDKQIFSLESLLKYASGDFLSQFNNTLNYLKSKNKILFITTSNRYQIKDKPLDLPKSSQNAMLLSEKLGEKATIVDGAKLKIDICEGNVSRADGNSCGVKDAVLKDKEKTRQDTIAAGPL